MDPKFSAFLPLFLAFCVIITSTGGSVAMRGIQIKEPEFGDMRKPDCHADEGFLISGIGPFMKRYAGFWGRIPLPGIGRVRDINGGYQPRYIPGYDDTAIPNPGFEVPISGDGVYFGNDQP